MNRILCVLMAVLALCALIDCNDSHSFDRVEDGSIQRDICSVVGCVNQKQLIRKKRENGRAVEILGGVERLVTAILNANWKGIERVKAQRRKQTIVVGPGKHNRNRVTINSRYH